MHPILRGNNELNAKPSRPNSKSFLSCRDLNRVVAGKYQNNMEASLNDMYH